MSDLEKLPSTVDPAPEDTEPPSPGTMRSWGADWRTEPFKEDIEYAQWLKTLGLLAERTREDEWQDEQALVVTAIRRVRIREEHLNPTIEPSPKTAPQRLGEFARNMVRRQGVRRTNRQNRLLQ